MKERNAGHSTETEKVIRTTDRGHPALGPFRTVVRQHRVDQRRAILWPGRFNLRSEGRYGLLGSLETHLAGFDVVLAGGDGHDCAEQVIRQQVSPNLFVNHLGRLATQDVHLHG